MWPLTWIVLAWTKPRLPSRPIRIHVFSPPMFCPGVEQRTATFWFGTRVGWTGIDWFVGLVKEVVIVVMVPYVSVIESALAELATARPPRGGGAGDGGECSELAHGVRTFRGVRPVVPARRRVCSRGVDHDGPT